jgi:hypothetical protein
MVQNTGEKSRFLNHSQLYDFLLKVSGNFNRTGQPICINRYSIANIRLILEITVRSEGIYIPSSSNFKISEIS